MKHSCYTIFLCATFTSTFKTKWPRIRNPYYLLLPSFLWFPMPSDHIFAIAYVGCVDPHPTRPLLSLITYNNNIFCTWNLTEDLPCFACLLFLLFSLLLGVFLVFFNRFVFSASWFSLNVTKYALKRSSLISNCRKFMRRGSESIPTPHNETKSLSFWLMNKFSSKKSF